LVLPRCGWLLALALTWGCNTAPPITALTDRDCPDGARVSGAAPPAGTLQRCELAAGVRHGPSRAWYDNGRLRYETEWRHGVKHGTFTFWYDTGRKRAEGRDQHGIPDGTWTYWAEDGTVTQERVFNAQARDGGAEAQRREPTAARAR